MNSFADVTRLVVPAKARLWSTPNDLCQILRLPLSLPTKEGSLQFQHRLYRAGQHIHSYGQICDTLYLVHSGFIKSVLPCDEGEERVLGFPMKGSLLGTEAMHSRVHTNVSVAQTDCDIVLLPLALLSEVCRSHPEFAMSLQSVMSRQLQALNEVISSLSHMPAPQRVSRFLLKLSAQYASIGYSSKAFTLCMSRSDIGNHLGLSMETVSRTLRDLAFLNLIEMRTAGHEVVILDPDGLNKVRHLNVDRPSSRKIKE